MKRTKRTVYILPDLSARVDEVAAQTGESPNAIIETALGDFFARESVYGAVEAQTRRLGEIDERVKAQNATLKAMGDSINALGKLVVEVKQAIQQDAPRSLEPANPEPARSGLLGGWRR
jgi:predicted transcriptional regulator